MGIKERLAKKAAKTIANQKTNLRNAASDAKDPTTLLKIKSWNEQRKQGHASRKATYEQSREDYNRLKKSGANYTRLLEARKKMEASQADYHKKRWYGRAGLGMMAGAGAAGIVWHKGKLQEILSFPVPRVHLALRAGLKDMGIDVTEDRHDNLTAEVRAELADGRKVWVDVESTGTTTSKLTIRVGVLGDKDFSLRIRDAIKQHL